MFEAQRSAAATTTGEDLAVRHMRHESHLLVARILHDEMIGKIIINPLAYIMTVHHEG